MHERRSGKRAPSKIEAEQKAERLADALLLGVPVEDVEEIQADYFKNLSTQEEVEDESPLNKQQLKQEAERDAAKWSVTNSAVAGDSSVSAFAEEVDLKIDQTTGKFDAGD